MDNRFLKDDLIERYVLNQLNDEELANFRGQLMFDEALRKQVVETKMLMNGLAIIAGESIISNPSSASKVVKMPASNNKTMLRAAMVIGVLMLAGMTYYFYNSSTTSTTASSSPKEEIQENIQTPPIQVDENATEEENVTEPSTNGDVEEKTEEAKPTKPRVFARNVKKNSSKSTVKEDANPEEEMAFGSAPSLADNSSNFFEEDIMYGIGDTGREEVNEFIEDAITNSTTKSSIGIVKIKNFNNSDVLKRNQHNAVKLNFEGTIDTKASNNKKYVFKLFNNNKDAFISNTPLYKEALEPLLLGTEQYDFKIEENIELKPGLYYFTIEEEVDSDQDMIYAGRFYVSAGKFHVK